MPCIERQKSAIIKKPANYPKHSALFGARQNTMGGLGSFIRQRDMNFAAQLPRRASSAIA
jgi:hypothetical protein